MRDGAILDRRYRVEEKLAEGGFGAIYRALDLVMGREVALKVLHRALVCDPSVVERFRREASALAKLRDPHTITMYDAGETPDGTRYIVMELLRGESLFQQFYAHDKRLPWQRVAKIARGVCSSLREAHAVGIVHRDLKPANIHLEKHALQDDFVKVLDFGIAKMVDVLEPNRDLTLAGQMIGTFDYMPPEQMIGGMCTGRSDVFTLAVVMYEMICGERPYGDAKGPASMLMTLLGTTPVPLAERVPVPLALSQLLARALERDPGDRMDVGDFDDELARILDVSSFEEEEARFSEDDGPTLLDPAQQVHEVVRRTPTNLRPTPNSMRRPYKAAPTMIGMAAPMVTPAKAIDVIPPVLPVVRIKPSPTKPTEFAVGSSAQIEPVPRTAEQPAVVLPLPAPPDTAASPRVLPQSPARSRDHWILGITYAVLASLVAAGIYMMY